MITTMRAKSVPEAKHTRCPSFVEQLRYTKGSNRMNLFLPRQRHHYPLVVSHQCRRRDCRCCRKSHSLRLEKQVVHYATADALARFSIMSFIKSSRAWVAGFVKRSLSSVLTGV